MNILKRIFKIRETIHLDIKRVITMKSLDTVIEKLENANPLQDIVLHISSGGGSCASMYRLMLALRYTKATVRAKVRGDACSAAAMIMTQVESVDIADDASIMFHYPRITYPDNSVCIIDPSEVVAGERGGDIPFFHATFVALTTKGLLTTDEFFQLSNKKDVYITGSEYNKRKEVA